MVKRVKHLEDGDITLIKYITCPQKYFCKATECNCFFPFQMFLKIFILFPQCKNHSV